MTKKRTAKETLIKAAHRAFDARGAANFVELSLMQLEMYYEGLSCGAAGKVVRATFEPVTTRSTWPLERYWDGLKLTAFKGGKSGKATMLRIELDAREDCDDTDD